MWEDSSSFETNSVFKYWAIGAKECDCEVFKEISHIKLWEWDALALASLTS
jgi:hypothetical protein